MKSYAIICTYEGYADTYVLFDDNEFAEWTTGGCWKKFSSEKEAMEEIERIKEKDDNPLASYDILDCTF